MLVSDKIAELKESFAWRQRATKAEADVQRVLHAANQRISEANRQLGRLEHEKNSLLCQKNAEVSTLKFQNNQLQKQLAEAQAQAAK